MHRCGIESNAMETSSGGIPRSSLCGSSLKAWWRLGPSDPDRRPWLQFLFGHGRQPRPWFVRFGVAPGADAQGRCDGVGSGEIGSTPSVTSWRWRAFSPLPPTCQNTNSHDCPISLVKLPSIGLGHNKREVGWAVFARPSFFRLFLNGQPFSLAVQIECSGRAAASCQSSARLHSPAGRTAGFVALRSVSATSPG